MIASAAPAFRNGHTIHKNEGDCMWREPLEALPPPRPVTALEAAEALHEDGIVQIPDLFTPAEVAEIRAWMDAAGGPDDAKYDVPGWCYNRLIMGKPHRDPMWLKLMDRDPIYECVRLVHGENATFTGGAMWTTGKGRAMGLHVDRRVIELPEELAHDPRVRIPIFNSTLQLFFDDQVEGIGRTTVIPGSFRACRHPANETSWRGLKPQAVSLRAGGGLLFRPDVWHGAELHTLERRRYVIQLYYGVGDRSHGFPPMVLRELYSPEVLARVTPRQSRMMGDDERNYEV